MPLRYSKSKSAFRANIRAEVAAGKPVKQAVAIAYSMQRAKKKRKVWSNSHIDQTYTKNQ